jgi:hypothetical protein
MKITLKRNYGHAMIIGALLVFSTGHAQYCIPEETDCSLDDQIANVTFAGINNNSDCDDDSGYFDYTGVAPAEIISGMDYPISVTVGGGGNEAIAVWIDFNQNMVFEESELTYLGNVVEGEVSGTITVPVEAVGGNTRMRVKNAYIDDFLAGDDPDTIYFTSDNPSCEYVSTDYGETEDYTVTITPSAACTGTPVLSTPTSTVAAACGGTTFTLNVSVTPAASGLSYQWQSSTDGGETWANLGAAQTSAAHIVTGQAVATSYQVVVTCATGSESATSGAVAVTQNGITECYCMSPYPMICDDGDLVLNVTIGSINNTTDCGDETGYSDYTESIAPPELAAGTSVPVSVTVGPSGDGWMYESVGIWIDYNHNGVFDDTEYTYVGTGLDEVLSSNINIPTDAMEGDTRMRVFVSAATAEVFDTTYACGPLEEDNSYGEMEDYAVTITGALSTPSFGSGKTVLYPNPTSGMVAISLKNAAVLNRVDVYTVTGQLILSKNYSAPADIYNLDMQEAAAGVYLLKLQSADATYTQRLIKN